MKISDDDWPEVFAKVAQLAEADGLQLVIEDNPDDFDNPLIKLVRKDR